MSGQGPEERAEAIAAVVAQLERIRYDAGTPSFREMAKRSGAISHATLHDAVRGTRLPSWETTVEFVRACDSNPAEVRDTWARAQTVVRRRSRPSVPPSPPAPPSTPGDTASRPDPATPPPGAPAREPDPAPLPLVPAAGSRPDRRGVAGRIADLRPATLVGAGVVVGVLAAIGGSTLWRETVAATTPPTTASAAPTSPSPCPSNTGTFPHLPPRQEGDKALLVADVTLPDCSTQPRAAMLTKTWRLENQGSVDWRGRRLRRIDPVAGTQTCPTTPEVTIPDTKAGQSVDVSVDVTTPATEGVCFGRWMVVDRDGEYSFPGQRPFFFSFFVR